MCADKAVVLSPKFLLDAYRKGFFPMAGEDGAIEWHSPDPRAIIPLEAARPNARFLRLLRGSQFQMTMDTAFTNVMDHCATVHGESWISPAMVEAYTILHLEGHAHSVECWHENRMVGGIYGVSIGAAFFGESMFSLVPNASKAAFFRLAEHLRSRGFQLLDTQYANAHTVSLGAIEISRRSFLAALAQAAAIKASF